MHLLVTNFCLLCLALSVAQSQTHGDLRLKQKNATNLAFTEGRLEIFLNGRWGTICEDSFDATDANVACRQLGFAGSTAEPRAGFHSRHGKGSELDGPIWLDEIGCTDPNGLHLLSCVHLGIGVHNCDHFSDVAIICSPNPLPVSQLSLRLQGGAYPSEGQLEAHCNNEWKPVCGDDVTRDDADSLCKELGYTEAANYEQVSRTNSSAIPLNILLDCVARDSVQSCPCSAGLAPASSCSGELHIHCTHTVPYGSVQLVPSTLGAAEVVEVFVNGAWRQLCADTFTESDADAVCGKMGFLRAETLELTSAQDSRELLVKHSDCDLSTDELFACLARESLEACSQPSPVAVVCTDNPPPTNTSELYSGRSLPFSVEALAAFCLAETAVMCFCCLFGVVCCTHLFCNTRPVKKRDRPLLDRPKNTFTFTDIDSKLDDVCTLEMKTTSRNPGQPPPPPQLVPCAVPQIPTGSPTPTLDRPGANNSPYPFPQEMERLKLRFSQENLLDEGSPTATLLHNLQHLVEQLEPPEEFQATPDSYQLQMSTLESILEEGSIKSDSDIIQQESGSETEF